MVEIWAPVVGTLGFAAIIVAPFIVSKIIKFKLEIARINAETTIRTEEIRARNQFEIEKFMELQGQGKTISRISGHASEEAGDRPAKNRIKE